MTIQACKGYVFKLLAYGTVFSQLNITESAVTAFGSLKPSNPSFVKERDNVTLKWNYTIDGSIGSAKFSNVTGSTVVIASKFGNGDVNVGASFQERFTVDVSNTLTQVTILSVQRSDHGSYEFEIVTIANVALRDTVELIVQVPPVISDILGNQTVNDSDLVDLTCRADGKPTPNITWTRVSDNSSVCFPFAITGKQDEGLYRCTAGNGIGNPASRDVFITVQYYRPINTDLSGDSVIINATINITCRAQANPPAKYQFYRNQVSLKNDTTGSDVSVMTTSVSERIKQVNYSCTPFNNFGAGPTEVITVTVLYAPDGTTLTTVPSNTTSLRGSIMSLNCGTDASPEAEYHFYFNGKSIGKSITGVFSVAVVADGVYTCVPKNTVGTGDNATVSISVVVAPSAEIPHRAAIVLEGKGLVLICNALGKPKPVITWTKVGSSEVLSNTSSLTIVNVSRPGTPDNMIQYQCTASNGVKSPATVTAAISVHYPASITNQGNETFNVKPGKEVNFLCLGDGNPTPTVKWTSKDGSIDQLLGDNLNNATFTAKADSSGLYLCTIKNYLGEDFKWFQVVVESKNILIMVTITNKGCNDNPQEISERLRTMVDELLKAHKQLKAVKVINVKCGSVTVYLSLEFNQNVEITEVLSVLKNAAAPEGKGFGEFVVDSESIQAISKDELPTDSFISTTDSSICTQDPTGNEKCECSCKDALFGAIIGILVLVIILLIIYVVWLHKKGNMKTTEEYMTSWTG